LPSASLIPDLAILFLVFRLAVLCAAWARRRVRRRLRWQLMSSQIAVILLTLIAMTSVGSIAGFIVIVRGAQPNAELMAESLATQLAFSRDVAPFNAAGTNQMMREVVSGLIELRGQPPLAGFVPRAIAGRPDAVLILRPDGQVLAQQYGPDAAFGTRGLRPGVRGALPPATLALDRRLGLRKKILAQIRSGNRNPIELPADGGSASTRYLLAAAPVYSGHKVAEIAVLVVPQFSPAGGELYRYILALFGFSTIALMAAIALPVLALSALFSVLVARGLTRRLESVSDVATSIASGNLSQRAPVTSENEVGRLAQDINRMATHLETTMGELHHARHQAEEALHKRQQLVANISHELRTPLAVVRAHLESLLSREPVAAGGGSSVETNEVVIPAATFLALQNETERLTALVDDLFSLSRVETGALEVNREVIGVGAIVNEVASLMRPLAQQEGAITLSVDAPSGIPRALGDPERLRQILANLVRNAVRHTPDGGIIVLAVAAGPDHVELSVADTGEGIPAEHVPHVFERFYRVDESRNRSSGGAGLGLAIVREFVELMGGYITVESVVGEGTCFRVHLQRAETERPQ
ncbi:MAG TPA: ATP-binding protein, partial [Chloroflexota bacterium]